VAHRAASRQKHLLLFRALIVIAVILCAGVAVGVYVAMKQTPSASLPPARSTDTSTVSQAADTTVYSSPVRLRIAKLSIDASVDEMGVTSSGNMAVPTDIQEVGWYKYGTTPGTIGSAVIAGHLIGQKGEPGIFIKLNTLKPGDAIAVLDSKNQTSTFTVREIRTYAHDEQPRDVFTPDDAAHLNLITCSGDWDPVHHNYADRLVVFADKSR